jgi:DNA-binding NarL/FixJ family response regulator
MIAVRRVLLGESYLSPMIIRDTVEFLLRSGAVYHGEKPITGRQKEILQLLAEGRPMRPPTY